MMPLDSTSARYGSATQAEAKILRPEHQHAAAVKAARGDNDDGLHFIAVPGGETVAVVVIVAAFGWVLAILGLLWLTGVL